MLHRSNRQLFNLKIKTTKKDATRKGICATNSGGGRSEKDRKLKYESVKHFGYNNNPGSYRAFKKVVLREVARKSKGLCLEKNGR